MRIPKHIRIILPALLFLLPAGASAATISLVATPMHVGVGDIVRVDVLLSSDIPTNAFSGTLDYPATMLDPIAVSDSDSIISAWITAPAVPAGGPIVFAGITPGGFSGSEGSLFSVLFKVTHEGTAHLSLGGMTVLRDDGLGTQEPVTAQAITLAFAPEPSGGYTEPAETTPPEAFTIYLGSNPQLFFGQRFIAFSAADKGSGIASYSVAETRAPSFLLWLFPLSWHEATSPYVLTDQRLTSTIYVKAVDRSGQERLSVFPRRNLLTPDEWLFLILLLVVVVLLWQSARVGRLLKRS